MKLTKWFDGSKFVPAHTGVYERKHDSGLFFAKWDGGNWIASSDTVSIANKKTIKSLWQSVQWRGLSEQPK